MQSCIFTLKLVFKDETNNSSISTTGLTQNYSFFADSFHMFEFRILNSLTPRNDCETASMSMLCTYVSR